MKRAMWLTMANVSEELSMIVRPSHKPLFSKLMMRYAIQSSYFSPFSNWYEYIFSNKLKEGSDPHWG